MDGPSNGNVYIPFTELMKLERLDEWTFKSTALAFGPAGGFSAYGGHVYAQAVWAASHTVRQGLLVHSVTGYFTLGGDTSLPFVYRVRKISEGQRFCVRGVDVIQKEKKGICFSCICSFKLEEPTVIDTQEEVNLYEEYKVVLSGKRPEDWPECPGVDSPWYWENSQAHGDYNDTFPGLSVRKVDMTAYNAPRPPISRRQLQYYCLLGDLPPVTEKPNLHACAHLYASDRNSLFIVPNFLDQGNNYRQMASLSHGVVFHVGTEKLNMVDSEGRPRWFCDEARVTRTADGRGMREARIWDESGVHLATTWQDGLVRIGQGEKSRTIKSEIESATTAGKEKL